MATKNKVLTLVFVMEKSRILLGLKKRGFGVGRWNGFGGKVEKQESIEEGAKRELHEECGLTATSLEKVGVISFEFVNEPPIMEVHVFKTSEFLGEPTESEEMKPQWFSFEEIPFSKMWPDDEMWFPHLLSNKKFDAFFKFRGLNTILEHQITLQDDTKATQTCSQSTL